MKKLISLMMIVGVACATLTLPSCMDDDGYSLGDWQESIATVETESSTSSHFFRLDDGTTLWPAAGYYQGHNLEDRQRVYLNYTVLSDSLKTFSHYVKVNDIALILTKPVAEDKLAENDSIYGTDPVEVKDIWIGGGFLNIIFTFHYGGTEKHFVNLVKSSIMSDPYDYKFHHNAYDDVPSMQSTGIICFDLKSVNTGEKSVTFTFRVNTPDGEKLYKLEYDPKKQNKSGQALPQGFHSGNIE